MLKALISAILLLQVACGMQEQVEPIDTCDGMEAYDEYRSLPFYPWSSNEIIVVMDETVSQDLKDASTKASEIWNSAIGYELIKLTEGRAEGDQTDPSYAYIESNIIEVKDGWLEKFPTKDKVLGTTFKDSVILVEKGIARPETSWFDIYVNRTQTLRDLELEVPSKDEEVYDLTSVMLHEFGHGLGLPHNDKDPASVMYSLTPKNRSKRQPCPVEARIINEIYQR